MVVFVLRLREWHCAELRICQGNTFEEALNRLCVDKDEPAWVGTVTDALYGQVEEGGFVMHVEMGPRNIKPPTQADCRKT